MNPSNKVFLLVGEETEGPYTVEEALQLWRTGDIPPQTLWARPGDNEWMPLQHLPQVPTTPAQPVGSVFTQSVPVLFGVGIGLGGLFGLAMSLGGASPSWIVLGMICGVVYVIPGLFAQMKNRRNRNAIIALNLLLGWTFIGWAAALVWALCEENRSSRRH